MMGVRRFQDGKDLRPEAGLVPVLIAGVAGTMSNNCSYDVDGNVTCSDVTVPNPFGPGGDQCSTPVDTGALTCLDGTGGVYSTETTLGRNNNNVARLAPKGSPYQALLGAPEGTSPRHFNLYIQYQHGGGTICNFHVDLQARHQGDYFYSSYADIQLVEFSRGQNHFDPTDRFIRDVDDRDELYAISTDISSWIQDQIDLGLSFQPLQVWEWLTNGEDYSLMANALYSLTHP